MNQSLKRGLVLILIALVIFGALYFTRDQAPQTPIQTAEPEISADITAAPTEAPQETDASDSNLLDESGSYTSKEDVALYLHQYGHLPPNFITKKEAQSLGWSGGSLENYAPGMCIGGDRFGNYEGTLPRGNYHECDINTLGKSKRGAERIVFSNDGLIFYTGDHYESFELLYGEETP